jgi:hypothetical protein
MDECKNHDHPELCAVVSATHQLEHAVADWAKSRHVFRHEVDTVVEKVTERIRGAALLGSIREPSP